MLGQLLLRRTTTPLLGQDHCWMFGLVQSRGRKRNLKPLSKQKMAELRKKKEEKEAERKKMSPSQEHPGRYDAETELVLPATPVANVFLRAECRTQFYSVSEALRMHRIMCGPSVFDNPNAPVRLRIELNMSTEKASKMISNVDELVPVPFPFEHKEKRAILAFAPTKQLQEAALEAGADIAIGKEMVKKILKGEFRTEDYDFCVAHTELEKALVPLKSTLKSRYPSTENGALSEDLPTIIKVFQAGVKLAIKGDPIYPQWGLTDCIVGKLNMSDEQLEANIESIVRSLCKHRNPALGPFINRAVVMTSPGSEYFALKVDQWCPQATEEQINKLDARKKKKKTKATPTVVLAEESEKDQLRWLM